MMTTASNDWSFSFADSILNENALVLQSSFDQFLRSYSRETIDLLLSVLFILLILEA